MIYKLKENVTAHINDLPTDPQRAEEGEKKWTVNQKNQESNN